ncbi:mitotic checkpoint serine/threonine-protein kinase BUB1 [Rutidosis leptorrhynchoides]|uniref:mitotic checkpoint serine/threonine-protein kinase BUB1 n=1 Tax=Rutidosis leptorrhynchoides TaxID=125765 RepID=UPI003A98CEE7
MTVIPSAPATTTTDDPLLPHLWSIKSALDKFHSSETEAEDVYELVHRCIETFKYDPIYQNDIRFLHIWLIYIDFSPNHKAVFREIERLKICLDTSMLYELYAMFLEAKGMMREANSIYQLGISRNAEPIGRLKKAHTLFLERMQRIVDVCSALKMDVGSTVENDCLNPWSISIIKDLLQKMNAKMSKYEGYYASNRSYSGKVALSSLQKLVRNKVTIEIGGEKYQIKGCAGKGGFAQVYKACISSNADEVVALKIQKPPFPWEYYMYRQLDQRIPETERSPFGYAHRLHLYTDYSILVSEFLGHGTLLDAINTNVCTGASMDELLCIYYTTEMLSMLESLHRNGIIHGDFKPDNLLMRYASGDLTEDSFQTRTGFWREQGLCLVDWGRGIDLQLFPNKTKFNGDCRTSGFRCVQMQENKPWTYQVDTYGLCVIVHLMLHNSYNMEIEKKASPDGSYLYQPKSPFKRYHKVELWKKLFLDLLNHDHEEGYLKMLVNLKTTFQDYMCSNPLLIKQLKQALAKQRISMGSS